MQKLNTPTLLVLLALLLGVLVAVLKMDMSWYAPPETPGITACPADAQVCPDGTTVGRVGPQCEFAACPSTPVDTSTNISASGDLALGVGDAGHAAGLEVTFHELVQDSRCPVDAQCIEGGAVNTRVTLTDGERTETRNIPSDEVPYRFGPYAVSVVAVAPDRRSGEEFAPSEYVVTFHVERVE